jgi:rfaE bifunctional protein kinase chain/domain
MTLIQEIKKWKNKNILIIGDALVDKYIFGNADRISPDAPVPNIKIEKSLSYIGAIGLVLKHVKSLGGIPEVCSIIGNDFEGDFFLKRIKELDVNSSGILIDEKISTPQITRIKAMDQHVLRLETDYITDISENLRKRIYDFIETRSQDINSILILDYGIGGLFDDFFIQQLLKRLKKNYSDIPIIVRPSNSNYYLYENVDIIRMNLQKALNTFSIDCCNETSLSIVGKKILNSTKCKHVLLNYLETESYLLSQNDSSINKYLPILTHPVRSYVAVGSVLMATLSLSFASKTKASDAVKIALYAAALTASLPPVEFYNTDKLIKYISENSD